MTDMDVSDVYVRLGNDFNAAVAGFAAHGIEMRLVPPPSYSIPSVTQTPSSLKPFHDLANFFLSPKIYEASWRPV